MNSAAAVEQAVTLHRAGRFAEAEQAYRDILRQDPRHPDALHLLGVLAHQHGRHGTGCDLISRAIAANPGVPTYHDHLGLSLLSLGRVAEAADSFARALALDPGHVGAVGNLANCLAGMGRLAEAEDHIRRALTADCGNGELLLYLATFLKMSGRLDEAVDALGRSLALDPARADAHNDLGEIHRARGRPDLAEACYRAALAVEPDHGLALNNLGNALRAMGRHPEAMACLRQAIAVNPADARPYSNLGSVLQDLGRNAEAIGYFRTAAAMDPALSIARSNVILASSYLDGMTGEALKAEAEQWDRQMGILPTPRPAPVSMDPDRPLRVGYLSADFRDHAAGFFLEPLLTHHDRRQFSVFCYVADARTDAVTERMRATDSVWRPVHALDDQALHDRIRADGIDILVECSGHSAGNRLRAVAMKPAAIQISLGTLGHGGTTGLAAMDYWIGDPFIAPPGTDGEFSERLIRLPRLFAPFALRSSWPDVSPGPSPQEGLLIGCVADPARVTDRTVALWRRVLDALPGVRLILKHNAYTNPANRAYWEERFEALGEACRLEGIPGGWGAHMADFYGRVSFLFDGFPGTGATSAIIPLWMGVPVITMTGRHPGERYSASILNNAGLGELVAGSEDGFMETALALAGDAARLSAFRGSLRARVAGSAIGDPAGVTREMEAAYRQCWREECAGGTMTATANSPR